MSGAVLNRDGNYLLRFVKECVYCGRKIEEVSGCGGFTHDMCRLMTWRAQRAGNWRKPEVRAQ